MAETAIERYIKDQDLQEEKTPGKINTVDEMKEAIANAVETVGAPKPPVKYLKPLFPDKTKDGRIKDTSALRFGLFLNPALRSAASLTAGEDIIKKLESQDEKDYISGLDEVRKGVETGAFDLVKGTGSLLFAGTDLAFNTDFLSAFNNFMKDKEPTRPDTWRGDLVALMTQFGIPGGIIQKVVGRTKFVGKLDNVISKIRGGKRRKVATIARRSAEGLTIVGATDFLASEPGRRSIYFEPESTEGLTGRKRAAAEFRNKIKYAQEGALIGAGFPLVGKGMQIGYKYGLAPFVKTTAKVGAKGVDNAVFRPVSYLGSRPLVEPFVKNTAKTIRNATNYVLTKAIAPAIVSAFSGKVVRQLPKFEDWRLLSVTSPVKEERVIKSLDNFLSIFRSYGKAPKDIEGVSEKAMLFIKSRSRRFDRTVEGLEKKAYNLAKGFEKQYNQGFSTPALQKSYLDQVVDFLDDKLVKSDLSTELQPLAVDLKQQIKNTMKEFKELLPKGKKIDPVIKDLQNVEINRVKNYFVKSFATFTNPNYAPDQKVYNRAIEWVTNNVIKKNLESKINAKKDFPKLSTEESYKESAKMLVESILRKGRFEGDNPIRQLKDIGKLINFKDYKFIKTGEELPNVIKNLLGPEKNLKSSVGATVAEMISAMANKKAADYIANSGLKNKWLFRSAEEARNNRILDAQIIAKMPRLGPYMKSDLTKLYANPDYVKMFQGVGGILDDAINLPIYREIMQGKVLVQVGKTLYSPQTQVRNVTSAAFFALMNGHIGGKASVTNAMKIVLDDIFKAGQKNIDEVSFNEYAEKLVRLGVWDENVVASELKAIMDQIKNQQIRTSDQLFDKLIKMAPTDKVARLYAGGDNLWKHFGYEYSKSQLNMAIKNLDDMKAWYRDMGEEFVPINPITGKVKEFSDHLDEAAAYLLRNTYPTYSKVPPAIQTLRKLPLGAFISFPAEILRTGANIINLGLKETSSSNPAIRQMGLRRLMGAFMTSYATGTGLVQTAQFLTNSTDAQWDAYKRSSAAPWDSRSNLLPIEEWTDGEAAAINFSYFSPYDSLFAPMEAALAKAREQKLNPQETEQYVLELMFADDGPVMTFLSPFITEPIGFDRVLDVTVRNGRKDQGGTVYSASDNLGDKFIKSFLYILDGVQPGVTKSADKISGALGKDLTKGGKPLNLKDELIALFAGTRIIRIDTKKDLRYFSSEMNRLLRAVDENENFYNVNNYADNTPETQVRTYKNMQDEAFKIQKEMFIRIKDLQLLNLSEDKIYDIMKKSGVSKKLLNNLLDGIFTPVNYSKARFETKIETIDSQLRKDNKENIKFKFRLNEDYVFPIDKLDDLKDSYMDKPFFERGNEYDPEKFSYEVDKNGNFVLDENGSPIREEGFIKRQLRKVPPIIRKGTDKLLNPFSDAFRVDVPQLPATPQPIMPPNQLAQNTNLTRTQQALLSPEEQIIASRKT